MTEKPAHLVDVLVAAGGIFVALACVSSPAGDFEGQILAGAAHVAASVVLAAGCSVALRLVIRLERPRWVWPVVLVSLAFGFHGLIRVINALDLSDSVARRTHVAQWHTKYVSWRGSGNWVRRVVVASWKSPSEQFEFRVPEGAVTRDSQFAEAQRTRLRQAWELREALRMKEQREKRFGNLAALNPGFVPPLPPAPEPSMDELMFPESVPCDVLVRSGVLGFEHVVGLRLLNEP